MMEMKGLLCVIILLSGFTTLAATENCSEDDFACKDGERCIGKGYVCDDFANCFDESDEDAELCATWEYDYNDDYEEEEGGGGFFGFVGWGGGGGGDDYDEAETVDEEDPFEEDMTFEEDSESFTSQFGGDEKVEEESTEKCLLQKCEPKGPVYFETDKEYHYSYEMSSETVAKREGGNQLSTMVVTCNVTIQTISACEMVVLVENVVSKFSSPGSEEVLGSLDENDRFLRSIEEKKLRFSMLNGEVTTLCPSADEDQGVLNFKRGILSMLQNTMPKLHLSHTQVERDVGGDCEVTYQFEGSNGVNVVVSKTRNIHSCKSRSELSSNIRGIPYDFPTASNPLPIVETSSHCEQLISLGAVRKSHCSENYSLTPFSSEQGKIENNIQQTLTLISEDTIYAKWPMFSFRTNLLFDHFVPSQDGDNSAGGDTDTVNTVEEILDQIEGNKQNSWEKQTPAFLFKGLVSGMRLLSTEQLERLNQRHWGEKDRQNFNDALGIIGTAASIRFMAQEIPSVSDPSLIKTWMNSLSTLQSPSSEVLSAVLSLLKKNQVPDDAMLAAGALLNTYCLLHTGCSTHESVSELVSFFRSHVNAKCSSKSVEGKTKLLLALRGLGNAGLAADEGSKEALSKCIWAEGDDSDVKATAIEAFRRVPCNASRSALERMFMDETVDSELRILSYLGLMQCADYSTLHLVENILRNEQVNQVGSFVWTHLKNLQETGAPSKLDVEALLSNRDFEEKFKSDLRKYSRNVEWSGFYDPLNIGGSFESNLIFSQSSYVPRSVSFNLTADLFGRSFNFLEGGFRVEGFEKAIEHYLRNDASETETQRIKNKDIKQLIRSSTIAKEYSRTEPEYSFHMRSFGNDFLFHHQIGMENVGSMMDKLNFQNLLNTLKTGKEISLKKSSMPLQSWYQIPTTSGFPLRISLDGFATTEASAGLQMDLLSIMKGKAMINAHVKPTLSLDIKAAMILDGYSSKSGIELDASFFTSHIVDGKIEINGQSEVSVDVNLPQDKLTLYKASSKLIMIHGHPNAALAEDSTHHEEVSKKDGKLLGSSNCFSFVDMYGVVACRTTNYPAVEGSNSVQRLLLNGPIKDEVTLSKTDLQLTNYKYRYRWINTDEKFEFQILYDTPGSKMNRYHEIRLTAKQGWSDIEMVYHSPRLSLDAQGRIIWTEEDRRLDWSMNMNGRGVAMVTGRFKQFSKSGQTYMIPTLTVTWQGVQVLDVKGSLDVQEREKRTSQISVPVSAYYSVNLEFNVQGVGDGAQRGLGNIEGYVKKDGLDWDANLIVIYSLEGSNSREELNLDYNKAMQKESEDDSSRVKVVRTWRFSSTQFPYLNTKGKWASKSFPGSKENAIQGSFGRDFENPLNHVDLFHNLIFYGGYEQTVFNSTIAIKYPKKNLDIKIGGELYYDRRNIRTGFTLQYAKDEAVSGLFHWVRGSQTFLNTKADFHFRIPSWFDVELRVKVIQQDLSRYQFDIMGSLSPTWRFEVDGYYKISSSRLNSLHNLEMTIKKPSGDFIFSNSTLLFSSSQTVLASQIKNMDGSTYKIRMAYINQIDDYGAHQQKIELDLNLPGRHYYWHSEITFGNFITVSNDIHIDSFRDVNLLVKILKENDKIASVEINVFWDSNRDPNKNIKFKLTSKDKSIELTCSLFFLGNEYTGIWKSSKDWKYTGETLTFWQHVHSGEVVWKDEKREEHRASIEMSFDLKKSDKVEISAKAVLLTPLEHWKHNMIDLRYSRFDGRVQVSVNALWHQEESLTLKFVAGRQEVENGVQVECKLDLFSYIKERSISLSAGTLINRGDSGIKGTIFLQWDKDEIQFLVEAINKRGPRDVTMSLMTKVMTTLKDYNVMSAFVDFHRTPYSFILHSTAKWDEILYDLKCSGELHTVTDYLKGEIQLTTPQFGPDTASAKIRIFHDYTSQDEMLLVTGHWLAEEFSLKGRVSTELEDFRAEISLESPFKKLSQASLTLAFSTKEFFKTEVWARWNGTKEIGADCIARMNSMSDFLVSFTVRTPLPKYKEVRAELKNFFRIHPSVHLNSRIFGQLDDTKYGLGGIYEQGDFPKLRVGLELYYPTPDLKEVMFDICDNSSDSNMRYNFELKHGSEKQISVSTDFKIMEKSVDFSFTSGITLPELLGPEFKEVELEGNTILSWSSYDTDLDLRFSAATKRETYKVLLKSLYNTDISGYIEGNLALPYEHLRDLEYSVRYNIPEYEENGYLDITVTPERVQAFKFDLEGKARNLSLSFITPVQNFSRGHFKYQLQPQDVVKSTIVGEGSIEDHSINFDGSVYINSDRYVTKMEVSASSTLPGNENVTVTLELDKHSSKYETLLKVISNQKVYEGKIFLDIESISFWHFNAMVKDTEGDGKMYSTESYFRYPDGGPLSFFVSVKGLFEREINSYIEFQSKHPNYLTVSWKLPPGEGKVALNLDHFDSKKIVGKMMLETKMPGRELQTYNIKTSLENQSNYEGVDLRILIEIYSTNQRWNHILVDGNLKQVTTTPGRLQVYLEWPELEPVNFTAMASYSRNPDLDLRTGLTLNLTNSIYGLVGEVKNDDSVLSLKSAIWWQKDPDADIEKIKLEATKERLQDGFIFSGALHLPMFPRIALNKMDMKYQRQEEGNKLRIVLEVANEKTEFEAFIKSSKVPGAEGRASLKIPWFREGNPITLKFRQALTEDGYEGEYDLTWAMFDDKEKAYKMETVKAHLKHRRLRNGVEGKLELVSPLTKGNPVTVTYSIEIPKHGDVTVKFGIQYNLIKFGVVASRVVLTTATQSRKRTALEIDNILWPFGVAYLETVPLEPTQGNEKTDRVIIYDLENTDRRSSVSFIRKMDDDGGQLSIKGVLLDREVELTAGYKSFDHNLGADLLLTWSKEERIHCHFDWKDKSKSANEKNVLVVARVSYPLRIVLMEAAHFRSETKYHLDVTLNTNLGDPSSTPFKAVINGESLQTPANQKHLKGSATLSHPSLESDISLATVLQKNPQHPILFSLLLKYSSESDKDLAVDLDIARSPAEGLFTDLFEVTHYASNFHARANGSLTISPLLLSFDQDFLYMKDEGTEISALVDGALDLLKRTFHTKVKSERNILDLHLKVLEKGNGQWELQTLSETHNPFLRMASLQLHPKQSSFVLTINNNRPENLEVDTIAENDEFPTFSAEKIVMEGGLEDRRFVYFSMKHLPLEESENSTYFWIPDIDFMFKLNNSRLVSSYLDWRKRLEDEVKNTASEMVGITRELRSEAKQWLKEAGILAVKEAMRKTKPILIEVITAIKPLARHFKNESAAFKHELGLIFRRINSTEDEAFVLKSVGFILENLSKGLNNVGFIQRVKERLAKGTLREQIKQLVQKMKTIIASYRGKGLSLKVLIEEVKKYSSNFATMYDNTAKSWYLAIRNVADQFKLRVALWIKNKWHNLYYSYKPHILRTLHHIESAVHATIVTVRELMSKQGENFKSLNIVQTMEEIYQNIKSVYQNMSQRSLKENLKVIFTYLSSNLKKGFNLFLARVVPFVEDWKLEMEGAWIEISSYPFVQKFIDFGLSLLKSVQWGLSKIDFSDCVFDTMAFVLEHGYTIMSQTAIEAQLRTIEAKTDFISSPEKGEFRLTQKLPFVWRSFNEVPNFDDMLQVPYVTAFNQLLFPSSRFSVLERFYKYFNLNLDPQSWIPPFQATGYVVGEDHILTFDGHLINYRGSCEHVLTVDLVRQRWVVTIQYNKFTAKTIKIYVDGKVVEFSKTFKTKVNNRLQVLPLSLDSTFIWRSDGALHLEQEDGVQVTWNLPHDVVSIKIPKTAFLHSAGLLGTNNNEPIDDLTLSNGSQWHDTQNLKGFIDSWQVDDQKTCRSEETTRYSTDPSMTASICDQLFVDEASTFRYCFYQVDSSPFHKICSNSFHGNLQDSTPSAMAYKETCLESAVPVKLPVDYIRCRYMNASSGEMTKLKEGEMVTLKKEEVERAVDVILLVEQQKCNEKKMEPKMLLKFITMFKEGLLKEGVELVRFSLVTFGGAGPHAEPLVVTSSSEMFPSAKEIAKLVDHLDFSGKPTSERQEDLAFRAITYASNLPFKSPGKVVFALFPCTPCSEPKGFSFTTMQHILLNNAALLYVFKDDYFDTEKQSIKNKIVGYDSEKVYTLKDYKRKRMGDSTLLKQIPPPKADLNLCLPLALEMNGVVFSSEFIKDSKKKAERLGLVAGRTAGKHVLRNEEDQRCLCFSTQEVTPLLRCENWSDGDFTVLEKYGLDLSPESPHRESTSDDTRAGFYSEGS